MTKIIRTKTNVRKGAEATVAGDAVLERAVREARQMQAGQQSSESETPTADDRGTYRARRDNPSGTPGDRADDAD